MSKPSKYNIHLDVKYKPLEIIDVNLLDASNAEPWYNQTLTHVNDSVVRLGIIEGEFHWHKHDRDDEFFYVLSGKLEIELEDRTITLLPNQGVTIPRGVMHFPKAPEKTIMLMVETAAISPTGD